MRRREFLMTAAVAQLRTANSAEVPEQPFRQIHLDYHNSEIIPGLGSDFNAGEFAATLKSARVNSINVFAKCHHGWAYYDTKIAAKHPNLKIDLLGEMIAACKAAGIRVVYYYSLVWDVLQARKHPDWMMLDKSGKPWSGMPDRRWPFLCMNSPYLDLCVEENREILSKYEVAGVFFDILMHPEGGCFCSRCRDERKRLGLADSGDDNLRHQKIVSKRVEEKLSGLVRSIKPMATIFYNSRTTVGIRDEVPSFTHLEVESLPTGGWGYTHFQHRVRHVRTLHPEIVGMTGRFHRSWADFGGFKPQAALEYECLNFLANGAKACVGDQLHPRGRLDPVTYERIGRAYRKVEALEPWARGSKAVAEIGLISAGSADLWMGSRKMPPCDLGAVNMLVELHRQFDILDFEADLSAYRLVIVPDEVPAIPAVVRKLREYVARGGSLIVTHESLLDRESRKFALDQLGVRYLGPAKFKGEYMVPKPGAFPGVDQTAYFLYQTGVSIASEQGTEVLATYGHPYFDRTDTQYTSHRQTPMDRATEEPLVTRRGRIVYIANPFFRSYALDAYGVQKQVIGRLLDALIAEPVLRAPSLPSTAQVTLLSQGNRRIVHVLHYPLTRRAENLDIAEEPGLLENVRLELRAARSPGRVYLAPGREPVAFRYEKGYAVCELKRVEGHAAVVFE